jgi:hypothetical protein
MAMDIEPAGVARTLMHRFVMMCDMAGVPRIFMAMGSSTAGVARTLMTRFVMVCVFLRVTFVAMGSYL